MNKKKIWFIRIVAVFLALLMAGSVLVGVLSTVGAAAASRSALNSLKDQQKTIQQKKQDLESKINSIEYQQSTALAKKAVLDEKISLTQDEIDNITAQIEKFTTLIAEKEDEVVVAQQKEDKQWELYKERIRAMEENGKVSYFMVLFDARDFTDLLCRLDDISEIMAYDEAVYKQLQQARLDTIAAKTELENTKAEREQTKTELLASQDALTEQVGEAEKLIADLESNQDQYETLYSEVDAADAKLQKQIDDMTAELKRQEASGTNVVKGTGTYIWPSQASRLVTSLFGTRLHPVYHVYKTHSGIDIGASYGTNILAADSGKVVTATYSSSYGYYVIINHGGGNTTLYAHMSRIKVSAGESVTQGQVIGLVGSTGVSTGPHLHFEIRINGSPVNPLNYYTNYTISDSAQ